jgi:O-antigen/teichoic acid export membrane protein
MILAPFGLAWIPVMYAIAKREDAAHIFQLVFRWFSIVLLFATFALSLLSTVILNLFFPPAYHSAGFIIPIISLSTMFIGIYYFFMIGVYICRKTIFEFIFMLIAASVNLLLNIVLIPRFGAMGAAVSTLLAYIILVLVSYIVNQKIYPIRFEIGLFIIRLFVGVALYVGSSLLAHTQKPLISWSISIGTLILYSVFLMLLEGLSAKRLKKTFWYVHEALSKVRNKTYA